MRSLSMDALQERFDNHRKLHDFEVDELFKGEKHKPFTTEQYRWLCKGYRHFLIFDIESINFDARMGFMICWYGLKWDFVTNKTQMIYDQLEPADMKSNYHRQSFDFDERILGTLSVAIKECQVLVGHYISKFDVPFFCARCNLTKHDDYVPDNFECRVQDTWRITKTKYNMYGKGGNSLRNAGTVIVGADNKTSVDLQIWKTIYYQDHPHWKKNRKYICDHCEIDVYQNFELFKKLMRRVAPGGASI